MVVSHFDWRGIIHALEFLQGTQPFCYFSRTPHIERVNLGYGEDKLPHEHLNMSGSWDHMGETNSRIFNTHQITDPNSADPLIDLPNLAAGAALGGIGEYATKRAPLWIQRMRKITGTDQDEE